MTKTNENLNLVLQLEKTEKRLRIINSMMLVEMKSERLVEGIANNVPHEMLLEGVTPKEIRVHGFECRLYESESTDNEVTYRGFNDEDYLITIRYNKKQDEYTVEMLPGYTNVEEILECGLEPIKYAKTFKWNPPTF
ncbi:hypothetical protein COL36_06545 [Bacillus wiedmannii]|uniref:hypothetical protein n=1 Tax=Bacillus wiedmannii TaxID=1890302 RepID=UPI000BF999F1|nr:hypothetical protein [Bacillus wiedmannii]PFX62962.1 hypothetical protein COL36_06545 [Bacillus wiedmannii]